MKRASCLVLVWLTVWPLVMMGLTFIDHVAPHWSLAWRTFVLTAVLVPLISLVIAPVAARVVAVCVSHRTAKRRGLRL